jgi:short-subunit dehydrogenase
LPRVLIAGATSTIAKALAAEFATHGFDLIVTGRDAEDVRALAADLSLRHGVQAQAVVFDVLDEQARDKSLADCLKTSGESLAGAVTCLGYLGDQATAQADSREARCILDTNFTACVATTDLLAAYFEEKKRGFICGISSVAGDRGRQSNYYYGAAKGGFSLYLQGLRNRLFRSGVSVTTVKPGFVDTQMTFGRPGMLLVASPEKVAAAIYKAATQGKDVVYVPAFWHWIMLLVRLVPERVFKRMRL